MKRFIYIAIIFVMVFCAMLTSCKREAPVESAPEIESIIEDAPVEEVSEEIADEVVESEDVSEAEESLTEEGSEG